MKKQKFAILTMIVLCGAASTIAAAQHPAAQLVSKTSTPVPQPPYTDQAVANYIWTVLLPELQANMNLYPSYSAYSAAVIQLQTLYQQATVAAPSALAQILAQAESLANPVQTPPDVQQAMQTAASTTQMQSQVDHAVATMQNSITSLNQSIQSYASQFSSFNNLPASAAADLQTAQTDLQNAQMQLAAIQSSSSGLASIQSAFDSQAQSILSLAQQIEAGNDPNGSNLQMLQSMFAALTQSQTNFQQSTQTPLTTQVSSLNTFVTSSLAADLLQLQKDSGTITPPPPPTNGVACYLDLGEVGSQLWSFMVYNPTTMLNMTQYDQYLTSLFSQLKAAGVNQINLSFAQIGGIDSLLNNGANAASDDVVGQMLASFPGAFQELIKQAHLAGISVDLAFGGENGASMTIVGPGETAQGQAQKLLQFLQTMNIDAIDFDFESTAFTTSNSAQDAIAFMTTLHQGMMSQNKPMTLTIEGAVTDWPQNLLKSLFYDANNNLIFFNLFDDLNLMLYSESQYYIDANNDTWGIEQWLDLIGKQNSAKLHIGFEDNVNYASASASAGETYTLDTTVPGTAAAEIYMQLQSQLAKDGYPTNFGEPFFWPDENRHAPSTWSRYEPLTKNGVISVNFDTDVISAFTQKLQ